MEDVVLIEYLKKKGILNEHEYSELKSDMYSSDKPHKYSEHSNTLMTTKVVPVELINSHFNESYAKYIVSKMWHIDKVGIKYVGEKFSLHAAKEVCERYRSLLPQYTTHADIYIAINDHYHNYHCLYKNWFGDDTDNQIIESAITNWFKDDDHDGLPKVWEHFKED